jgi:TPR repeat protein
MHDAPSRTPSQPATAASLRYASPSPEVRRPDSRTQHNGSSYVQAPRNATPASQYAAEYQATHPSQPQQHPSYAQRLSYDNPRPDLANTPSEAGYPDQYQQQQEYQNQYAYAEPSSSYVASTSQQPYGYGQAPDPIYQHQGGYTEDPNAYYAQQNQVQDQYYDPNAQYYAQGGYDQQQYNHYQHGQDPTQMYNQGYGDAGQPYPNGPSYSSHEHQAPPSQQHNGDYFGEPSRVSSSSFSQSSLPHYPALNRNKTTVSAKSSVSAADKVSSTQPITKQAVDDYRNRIKSDPDPETQFNFARFLIEAARRLAVAAQQGSVDDAKSVKKYRDSLLQEAIKLIKRLAMQGSGLGKPAYADAQFFLANCLGHGALGLNVDHEKAYNLYVQASKQNHPAATYRTAVCNEVGAGTRREPARAVLFYRKASALGDTAGMYKLGMILLNGLLGQQKNPREAVIWLKKAAAQADEENPHALHELGVLYEKPVEYMQNGQATPSPVVRDEAQAREFYTQAAQLGHAPSQCKLGACYEYGSLTCPVDPRRSIAWYTVSNDLPSSSQRTEAHFGV